MRRVLSIVLALCAAVAARAADLSEYVSDGLVAMWDGYLNQGSDKPHDGTATKWYDTTGTHYFELHRAFFADLGVRFSKYSSFSYADMSAESTAATFGQITDGTVEVVYWNYGSDASSCLLQSSTASGVAIGRASASKFVLGAQSGSVAMTPPAGYRLHTVSALYTSSKATGAALNGEVVTAPSTEYWSGDSSGCTYLGSRRSTASSAYQGSIYAIRVYNRLLSAAELAQNAKADRERYDYRKLEATSSYATVDYTAGVTADQWYYVAKDGSDANDGSSAHPFATVTNAHERAKAYLAAHAGSAAAVKIGAGTFPLDGPVDLAAGEKIIGAGRDKTFLDGSPTAVSEDSDYALRLNYDDNLVRGLAVINIYEITQQGTMPHAYIVKKGVVDACRSAFNTLQYGGGGYGMLIQGGTVTNCLIDHVMCAQHFVNGVGAKVESGLLLDTEICECQSPADRTTLGNALYISGSGSRASGCRIHDCGNALPYFSGSGTVYVDGGIFENSIVYGCQAGNNGNNATVPAGVLMKGGTMRYCTIANNTTFNDTAGYSGLQQTAGTVRNCIFMNNSVANNGVVVTAGTFETNLVDKAVTGYGNNFVGDSAYFKDLGANDFHIASRASLAVGRATPVADVTVDLEGVARAEKPTIGAYEYVAPPAQFGVEILVSQPRWREGSAPTAELAVEGVTDYTQLSVRWTVDHAAVPSLNDSLNPVFENLGLGYHTIGATATYGAKTDEKVATNAVALLPLKVYVGVAGSGTFPYATEETATNSITEAYDALWKAVGETGTVEIAVGNYSLAGPLVVDTPVRFLGAGRDMAVVACTNMSGRPFTISHADAALSDITLCSGTGSCGIRLSAGLVRDCLVSNFLNNADTYGGGIHVTGGSVIGCEITDCRCYQLHAQGGGLHVDGTGAVVSNCHVHGNFATAGSSNQKVQGGGLYLRHGLVTHCRIVDNIDPAIASSQYNGSTGSGVYMASQESNPATAAANPCILRNCLIARNTSSFAEAVCLIGGTVENCTVTENRMTADSCYATEELPAVRVCRESLINGSYYALTTMTNSIVWANGSFEPTVPRTGSAAATIGHSCWPGATEGDGGNTAQNPNLYARREYDISKHSTCFRAGAVQGWMTGAYDLKGRARLTKGEVDIGCQQVPPPKGFVIIAR